MVELIVLGAFALSLFVCVGLGVSILCALISYLTGTAFGTAATMGVICAALAAGMGIPAVYIGGAVISGLYFGDRCSPMSTSALLVSSLTGTDIYRNLGGMVKTSLVPFFVSVALYALLGLGLHGSYDVSQMQALFSGAFKLTPSVLLPAAVIILLSLFKVNVKAAMGVSIFCSAAICIFVQGAAPAELISDAVFGFRPGSQQLSRSLAAGEYCPWRGCFSSCASPPAIRGCSASQGCWTGCRIPSRRSEGERPPSAAYWSARFLRVLFPAIRRWPSC